MEMITTSRGGLKLLYKGYAYVVDRRKDNKTYWRCEKRKECNGRLYVAVSEDDSESITLTLVHNHPADMSYINALKVKENLKDIAKRDEVISSSIINSIAVSEDVLAKLPKPESLQRALKRARKQAMAEDERLMASAALPAHFLDPDMSSSDNSTTTLTDVLVLRRLISEKEEELSQLRAALSAAEKTLLHTSKTYPTVNEEVEEFPEASGSSGSCDPLERLTHGEIARYSRQMILPEMGMEGQRRLTSAKVLVVGCGGLGCPSAMYLAAAGVGTIGLLDYDDVEISNLHRQILHTETRVGMSKVDSVISSLRQLNSCISLVPHNIVLNSATAMDIIGQYDLVLDCTDNVATRYLLNDACVLSRKPLVSGAALRWEGQLTVYGYNEGPCYRCLFPSPPDPETVTNCSDGGVIGAVPGVIGSLQALEAIKIISKSGSVLSQAMLIFDGLRHTVMKAKLRGKQPNCAMCSDNATITELIDYEQFCGAAATDKDAPVTLLQPHQRVSVTAYKTLLDTNTAHVLVDVRQPIELTICSLPDALNIPLKELKKPTRIEELKEEMARKQTQEVICVCRRGNDSQLAAATLAEQLDAGSDVKDIVGGLTQWARVIDHDMPVY